MLVREATLRDVEAMSQVLIASITDLCARDHGDVRENIARWTANKTPESIRAWFDDPSGHLYVAEREGAVVAVGSFNDKGEVLLNYVAPEARFSGVSKALLRHMEGEMRRRGLSEARLESTRTAHDFYVAAGWRDRGGTQTCFNLDCLSMVKTFNDSSLDASHA
jgi:GNAT superfamily N-acetyltransferase